MAETLAPLFIVGTGRCGSTIFHDMMSVHPGVSYLSHLCDRYPAKPERNARLMRSLELPGAAGLLRRKYPPVEPYRFWDYYAPGFSEPFRDLRADDASTRIRRRLPASLGRAASPSRPRLLAKITGWPRLGFLHAVFPSAKFIHVYRDGRAVANSLLNVSFWRGWQGPDNWRMGPLTPEESEQWARAGHSFVALAGLQWVKLMGAFRQARDAIGRGRVLEISYERLCSHPEEAMGRALEFAGIPDRASFQSALSSFELTSTNDKWRAELTSRQQEILEQTVRVELAHWGYT